MNKLKLHVATVVAAANAVGKKSDEAKTIKEECWSNTGLSSKQDRNMFDYIYDDAMGVCVAYSTQRLPSELATEKHA